MREIRGRNRIQLTMQTLSDTVSAINLEVDVMLARTLPTLMPDNALEIMPQDVVQPGGGIVLVLDVKRAGPIAPAVAAAAGADVDAAAAIVAKPANPASAARPSVIERWLSGPAAPHVVLEALLLRGGAPAPQPERTATCALTRWQHGDGSGICADWHRNRRNGRIILRLHESDILGGTNAEMKGRGTDGLLLLLRLALCDDDEESVADTTPLGGCSLALRPSQLRHSLESGQRAMSLTLDTGGSLVVGVSVCEDDEGGMEDDDDENGSGDKEADAVDPITAGVLHFAVVKTEGLQKSMIDFGQRRMVATVSVTAGRRLSPALALACAPEVDRSSAAVEDEIGGSALGVAGMGRDMAPLASAQWDADGGSLQLDVSDQMAASLPLLTVELTEEGASLTFSDDAIARGSFVLDSAAVVSDGPQWLSLEPQGRILYTVQHTANK
eukprot:g919.t1